MHSSFTGHLPVDGRCINNAGYERSLDLFYAITFKLLSNKDEVPYYGKKKNTGYTEYQEKAKLSVLFSPYTQYGHVYVK